MFFPAKIIIQEEYKQYLKGEALLITNEIAIAFTPVIKNGCYNYRKFDDLMKHDLKLVDTIKNEIICLESIADSWQKQRIDTKKLLARINIPLDIIDDRFYYDQEKQTIIKDLKNFGIMPKNEIDISNLPSFRMMEYSQFRRIHMTNKKISPNDVMDVTISCAAPYMDAVITESFQADVYKKAKKFIPQLKHLEIYTLKDIRLKK